MNHTSTTSDSAAGTGGHEEHPPEHFDWTLLQQSQGLRTAPALDEKSTVAKLIGSDDRSYPATSPRAAEPSLGPLNELDSTNHRLPAIASATIDEQNRQSDVTPGWSGPQSETTTNADPPVQDAPHRPLPSPRLGVPRIGFSDVGEPSVAGEYRSRYGLVEITRDDLAVWKIFPKAVFTVIQPSPYSDAMVSRLGTFEF